MDPVKELAFLYDSTAELRYEIGEEEYERYLTALDRPIDVPVNDVFGGSLAESVGLRPGDKIVSYDGKRIFNFGELSGFSMERSRSGGGIVAVQVERNGQTLHFSVPAGPLGVRSRPASIDVASRIKRSPPIATE